MAVFLVFAVNAALVAIGYGLGWWHNSASFAVKEAMLEQRIERLSREWIRRG